MLRRVPHFVFPVLGAGAALITFLAAAPAFATTYRVGPSQTYKTPGAVAELLQPGDVVEIDGNATYSGGTAFWNPGEASRKITVRGIRVNGKRPVLTGGNNTIEAAGDHYVFEGLEITAGVSRCFFH